MNSSPKFPAGSRQAKPAWSRRMGKVARAFRYFHDRMKAIAAFGSLRDGRHKKTGSLSLPVSISDAVTAYQS
jgi:hypothetical protein